MSGIKTGRKLNRLCTAVFSALILLLSASFACAQEVLIRKDSFSTEVFLRINPAQIRNVNQNGTSVEVQFNSPIKPFTQNVEDPFIASIVGTSNGFVITFKDTADFGVFTDPEGLRFLGTRPRELDNVLLSYGVGAPMLRKDNIYTENPVLEAQLRQADALFAGNDLYGAINSLNNTIATTRNSFYLQEAQFRLGNVYMELGKYDSMAYNDAYIAYDTFIRDFPDSNRIMQVKILAAEAKEKSGAAIDAIQAHMDIYRTSPDTETRRRALLKAAEIYSSIGQYDSAIETYEEYLEKFRTDTERIRSLLGSLYIERGYKDQAYEMFSKVNDTILFDTLTNAELFNLAKIFRDKGDLDKALGLLTHLSQEDTPEAIEAWVNIAAIRQEQGDEDEYSKALEYIIEYGRGTQYAYDAMVDLAELHIDDRTADDWEAFLAPIFTVEDHNNLRPRSKMVIIKSLQREEDPFRLVREIDDYLENYPNDETDAMLLKIKEDSLFNKAVEYHTDKNYPQALRLYRQLLGQFPESPRVPLIQQYIDDIYYDMAAQTYNSGDYSSAVRAVEDWMLNSPPGLQDRWELLWEDSAYQYIMKNVGVMDPRKIRFKSREYLTFMPRGRYIPDIREVLEQNFIYPYNEAYNNGNDAEVIGLYEENKPWLDIWPDQSLNNTSKVTATKSLINLGMRDGAAELYKTITPMMTSDYAEAGFTLCQKNVIYDINRLSKDEFLGVVEEAERCGDSDYTLDLVKRYTADKKTALEVQYNITKNISDEKKREDSLNSLFQQLNNTPANQFEGYEEVFLDMGLLAYRKNDFSGAVIPLQRYADSAPNTSEKKAEALFYLGKSLIAMNEKDRGLGYYRQITTSMPDSVYKNMAQSELEDEAWINSDR